MSEQEKKQMEELADAGGDELQGDKLEKASGGLLGDYANVADNYIRCPVCGTNNIQFLDRTWSECSYRCNECRTKFEFNSDTKEYSIIKKGGGCS